MRLVHIRIHGSDNIRLLQSIVRYDMFASFNLLDQRDQLSLSNGHLYLTEASIDPFVFFVNNVAIKQDLIFSEESLLDHLVEAIQKTFAVFGMKLVAPLRTLSMRVLQANLGFLELHTVFLRVCRTLFTPADALPVLEYPAMFKHMRRQAQSEFLVEACDVCLQLRRYPAAYEFALRATRVEERPANALKRLNILSIYMRKSTKEFDELFHRTYGMLEAGVAVSSGPPLGKKQQEWQQELKRRQVELHLFKVVCDVREWRKLKEEEQLVLESEGLLEAFNESQHAALRSHIESDVKGLNWRIKASEVKGVAVGALEVARGVNQPKELYKYDCQERLMYFNHRACDQEQLNKLISKAFLMQSEASNCRIERKELESLGRMGGKKRRGDPFDFE